MAGVEGNGQTELAEAVIGVRRPLRAASKCGEEITRMPVGKRFERGLAHIPQDRVKEGSSLTSPSPTTSSSASGTVRPSRSTGS
ncbi:MAG: hypothetical protein ACLVL7_11840 [Anaerotruncus massiliensis (ex Togo et al. 2019)]